MRASGFKVDAESLRVMLTATDNIFDPTERIELSAARQRLSINKSNALGKAKLLKTSPPTQSQETSVFAVEKLNSVYSRGCQQAIEYQSKLLEVNSSIEILEKRRLELFNQKASLIQSANVIASKIELDRKFNSKQDIKTSGDVASEMVDTNKSDNGVLCPFFLMGECADAECPYFHPEK